jgi:hypothetical protein
MRAGSLLWHGRRGFCNDKVIQDGYSTAPSAAPLRRAPETISYARFTSRPEGVPSLGPAGHRRDGVQKPADSQPKETPELKLLILPERMRGGRSGTCPVLRQRSEDSMVPGYVQGGTRTNLSRGRIQSELGRKKRKESEYQGVTKGDCLERRFNTVWSENPGFRRGLIHFEWFGRVFFRHEESVLKGGFIDLGSRAVWRGQTWLSGASWSPGRSGPLTGLRPCDPHALWACSRP